MKKSHVAVVCLSALLFPVAWPQTLAPTGSLSVLPPAWRTLGNGGPNTLPGRCDLGIDSQKAGDGSPSYSVRCANAALPSFGGAQMSFDVQPYRGKRVRVSAQIMASGVESVADARYPNAVGEAGLWIAVGALRDGLKSDRMENRTIKGSTGWEIRDFVVDMPNDVSQLQVGYWMQGKGQIWMRDLKVEEVPLTVAVNFDRNAPRPNAIPALSLAPVSEPRPTDRFLPPPQRWLALGEQNFELCDAGIDAKLLASGQRNLSIACKVPVRAYLRHTIEAQPWWGKRVRFSAWLKTEGVEPRTDGGGKPGASLYLSTTGAGDATTREATVTGTTDWTYHELVLDIPVGSASPYIPMGLSLVGTGQLWARDFKFEEVPRDASLPVPAALQASVRNPLATGSVEERRTDALMQSDRTAAARVTAWSGRLTALRQALSPDQLRALNAVTATELRRETEESLEIDSKAGAMDALSRARLNEQSVIRQHATNLRILEKIAPQLNAEQTGILRGMFEAWVAPRLAVARADLERLTKSGN
jgi:hypothetical protein